MQAGRLEYLQALGIDTWVPRQEQVFPAELPTAARRGNGRGLAASAG